MMQSSEPRTDEQLDLRHARARDGAPLAFTSSGATGLAIVNPLSHGSTLAAVARTATQRPFLRAMAAGHQLVMYDQRGAGASSAAGAPANWQQRAEDLWAVADAAGVERAVLYGVFDGGHTVLHAAALHPERVLGLILNRVPVRFGAEPGAGDGVAAAELETWLRQSAESRAGLLAMMDAVGINSHDAALLVAGWILSIDAATAAAQAELLRQADVRPLLPAIEAPALVLTSSHRRALPAWAHSLAALLPRARLVCAENGGETLGAVHAFLAVLSGIAGRGASRVAPELSSAMSASTRSVGALRRIVVPVDLSAGAGRAVELACRLGEAQQAEIILAHVLAVPRALPLDHPLPEARRRGKQALALGEAISAEHGLPSVPRLLVARSVAESIIRLARDEQADLIVMARPAPAPDRPEEPGHTLQEIVRRAPCEVIIDEAPPLQHAAEARVEALR